MAGRQGKLLNLMKAINYKYQGKKNPDQLRYDGIQTKGNLLGFKLTWEAESDEEENWEYVVARKTSEGWESLWIGPYPVDLTTCEKYAAEQEVMEFGVFQSCLEI